MYTVDTKELRHCMVDAGFNTIEELSSASDINRNTLSGVLSGDIYPSSAVMQKLVNVFDIEPERAGRILWHAR